MLNIPLSTVLTKASELSEIVFETGEPASERLLDMSLHRYNIGRSKDYQEYSDVVTGISIEALRVTHIANAYNRAEGDRHAIYFRARIAHVVMTNGVARIEMFLECHPSILKEYLK